MENTNIKATEGFLLINKPKDISSYDCIRHIKRILKQKIKIGHTGTLDNFATGLLIICTGRNATKRSNLLLTARKEYIVTAKFGDLTDTLDLTGNIIKTSTNTTFTKDQILQAVNRLGKSYLQIPPIYSALKYKGKSLYELARHKKLSNSELEKIIQTKTRQVHILNFTLLKTNPPYFTFQTLVSKGTYVRSLANDIAKQLDSFATTYKLQRTKIAEFPLQNAINLLKLKTVEDIKNNLIPINQFKSREEM